MTDSGYAEFTSHVPLHSFTGKSNHLTGMIDPSERVVDFYIDLNTLKTGIGKRDRDMYSTLNVEEHPFAEFTGTLNSPIDMESTEKQTVEVTGDFTIHGVSREVTIPGTIQKNEDHLLLEAEWTLNLNDYNIEPPGILFYRVNEEQEVRIEATLLPQDRETLSNGN
ncbi:MAG: YceI family protein [Balneolaceae bacterium]